jgi:hypothetical protein
MPILEEEGLDDMLFHQDAAPPHFHKEITDFLNLASFQRNGLAGAGLSLGHLVHLTSLPLIFSFGGTSKMLCTCHHWLPLSRNLLGG